MKFTRTLFLSKKLILILSVILPSIAVLFFLSKIAFAAPKTWHSQNLTFSSSSSTGVITDDAGSTPATVEFFESSNNDGVDTGSLFDTYSATAHPDLFNNLGIHRRMSTSPNGNYPYVGKSTVARGSDGGESNTPSPTGVFDLQMHTPDNDHLAVAAFVVPQTGEYEVSSLAIRRVVGWGSGATLKVFNQNKTEVTSLQGTTQAWTTDGTTHNLGTLQAGDKIYFAVDRDTDFIGDAMEITWKITSL